MKSFILCCLVIITCGHAAAATERAVYVPLPAADHSLLIFLDNPNPVDHLARIQIVPDRSTGRFQLDAAESLSLPAHRTERFLFALPSNGGIAVIVLDSELLISAFLFDDNQQLSIVALPIISHQSIITSGQSSTIMGLNTSLIATADYWFLNPSGEPANCDVTVTSYDGANLHSSLFVFSPFTSYCYRDALGMIGAAGVSAKIEVTCDQPFYHGVFQNVGEHLAFLEPAIAGSDGGELPDAGPSCAAGAYCYWLGGTFLVPTKDSPTKSVEISVPPGNYSKATLQMKFYHGGWQSTNGLHNLFWFVVDRNRDMLGYANLYLSQIMLRHGMGLPHGEKPKLLQRGKLSPNAQYSINYVYDTANTNLRLTITGENFAASVRHVPNVDTIIIKPNRKLRIDIGFAASANPEEMPTYGWEYSDLWVQLEP